MRIYQSMRIYDSFTASMLIYKKKTKTETKIQGTKTHGQDHIDVRQHS